LYTSVTKAAVIVKVVYNVPKTIDGHVRAAKSSLRSWWWQGRSRYVYRPQWMSNHSNMDLTVILFWACFIQSISWWLIYLRPIIAFYHLQGCW